MHLQVPGFQKGCKTLPAWVSSWQFCIRTRRLVSKECLTQLTKWKCSGINTVTGATFYGIDWQPFRWPRPAAGRDQRPVSSAGGLFLCPFLIFTPRPLGCEQCCRSQHGILCPLHLLNNSMERGHVSSGIITVWGWQAPLSRARWGRALQCWEAQKQCALWHCWW